MMGNEEKAASPLEARPAVTVATATKVGLAGGLLAVVAALIGIPSVSPEAGATLTSKASGLGAALGAACFRRQAAAAMRPRLAQLWLLAAATCFAAGFGFPGSWDSLRFASFVFSGASVVGALLAWLPLEWRMGVASALAVFHFSGIFVAVTSPPPAPMLTNYLWTIVYRPYLEFAYLNNAYQFYSPDPGPASELWFCIYYEPKNDDPVKMDVPCRTEQGEPERDAYKQPVYRPMTNDKGEPAGEPIKDAAGNDFFKDEKDKYGNT